MLLDDFIRYVKIDTQSDDESELTPSTLKQYDFQIHQQHSYYYV